MIQYSMPPTEIGEQLVRVDKSENITHLGIMYYVWLFVTGLLFTITNIFCLQMVFQLVGGTSHHVSNIKLHRFSKYYN